MTRQNRLEPENNLQEPLNVRRHYAAFTMKTTPLHGINLLFVGIWALSMIGCGHYPSHLTSLRDIQRASSSETHVTILGLSTEEFPALSKFESLYEIDLDGGATDEQLEALAKIGFFKLAQVVLTDCPKVTDKGVASLGRIVSLKGLGLRGTAVGDEGCRLIASKMKLRGINLPNCPAVTVTGLLALTQSETIEEMGFSLNALTQAELIQIINAARRVNHIEIEIVGNADDRLDLPELRKAAQTKGIIFLGVHNGHASAL